MKLRGWETESDRWRGSILVLSLSSLLSACGPQALAQSFSLDWSSSGGSSGVSTGGIYSVGRTVGSGASDLMHGAACTVAGDFSSGTVIVPEFATSWFYVGLDLHNPAQALADFDGDGLSNLMEYALGIDPRNGTDVARSLVVSVNSNAGNQFLTMQFRRRHNSKGLGLQYIPEVSGDGQIWYSDSAVQEVSSTAMDTLFDWVTVRDLTPTTAIAPRFIRLRVVDD